MNQSQETGENSSTTASASEGITHSLDLNEDECPVCFDHMDAPRTLPCGHNVCHGCFEMWANLSNNCPFCKRPMEDLQTVLTRTLKNLQDHLQSSIDSLNKLKTIRSHISDDPRTGIISRQISKLTDLASEIGIRSDDVSDFATIHVMPDSSLNELMSTLFANIQPNMVMGESSRPHVAPTAEPPTRSQPPPTSIPAPAPVPSPAPQPQTQSPPVPGSSIPGFPADIFNNFNLFGVPQFDTTTTIRRQFHIRSPQHGETMPQTQQSPGSSTQPQMPNLANFMNGQNLDNLFSSFSNMFQQNGTNGTNGSGSTDGGSSHQ